MRRDRLDAMMRKAVREADGKVLNAYVSQFENDEKHAWSVTIHEPHGKSLVNARVVVDATGRVSSIAKRKRARATNVSASIKTIPAATSVLNSRVQHESNWLAVGDAALSIDPLSGQGVYRALTSGCAAGVAVARSIDQDGSEFAAIRQEFTSAFEADLKSWHAFYSQERRWPECTFWKRRHRMRPDIFATVNQKTIA